TWSLLSIGGILPVTIFDQLDCVTPSASARSRPLLPAWVAISTSAPATLLTCWRGMGPPSAAAPSPEGLRIRLRPTAGGEASAAGSGGSTEALASEAPSGA